MPSAETRTEDYKGHLLRAVVTHDVQTKQTRLQVTVHQRGPFGEAPTGEPRRINTEGLTFRDDAHAFAVGLDAARKAVDAFPTP